MILPLDYLINLSNISTICIFMNLEILYSTYVNFIFLSQEAQLFKINLNLLGSNCMVRFNNLFGHNVYVYILICEIWFSSILKDVLWTDNFWNFFYWKWLFGGTVPPQKKLFGDTLPPSKKLFGGTVAPSKKFFGLFLGSGQGPKTPKVSTHTHRGN